MNENLTSIVAHGLSLSNPWPAVANGMIRIMFDDDVSASVLPDTPLGWRAVINDDPHDLPPIIALTHNAAGA